MDEKTKVKKEYTDYFDVYKSNYNTAMGDIDDGIKTLMRKINSYEDIVTFFSCEGHEGEWGAYFTFTLSHRIWDEFWLVLIPKLISDYQNNHFVHIKIEVSNSYKHQIVVRYEGALNIFEKDGEITTGFFESDTYKEVKGNKMFVKMKNRSVKQFWGIVEECFIPFLKKYSVKLGK